MVKLPGMNVINVEAALYLLAESLIYLPHSLLPESCPAGVLVAFGVCFYAESRRDHA